VLSFSRPSSNLVPLPSFFFLCTRYAQPARCQHVDYTISTPSARHRHADPESFCERAIAVRGAQFDDAEAGVVSAEDDLIYDALLPCHQFLLLSHERRNEVPIYLALAAG